MEKCLLGNIEPNGEKCDHDLDLVLDHACVCMCPYKHMSMKPASMLTIAQTHPGSNFMVTKKDFASQIICILSDMVELQLLDHSRFYLRTIPSRKCGQVDKRICKLLRLGNSDQPCFCQLKVENGLFRDTLETGARFVGPVLTIVLAAANDRYLCCTGQAYKLLVMCRGL